MSKRHGLIVAVLAVALVACVVGAAGTAMRILRDGLVGPRAPLSALGTGVRVAFLVSAVVLFFARRDLFERVTLICVVVATASSTLFGVGVRSPALAAVRLISHLLGYSLGAIALARIWRDLGPVERARGVVDRL